MKPPHPMFVKVMHWLHTLSLIGLFAVAVWQTVMTIEGSATIEDTIPLYAANIVVSLLKIPSQVCVSLVDKNGWLSVIGSAVSAVILLTIVIFMKVSPSYNPSNDVDVCGTDAEGNHYCLKVNKFHANNCDKTKHNACSIHKMPTNVHPPLTSPVHAHVGVVPS